MQENKTLGSYFILTGISDLYKLQFPICLLILIIYLINLGSNLTILLLVGLDSQLHTPMYFLLSNLSFVNISSPIVTLHKIFIIFVTGYNIVSFTGCMAQMYIFYWLTGNELLLLTAMSYDRYAAICKPLHYSTIMSRRVCAMLAIFCWSFSFLQILPTMIQLSQLSCYTSNILNHFFCDLLPLISLSCSDTSTVDLLILTVGGLLCAGTPFLLTLTSYVFIIAAIMRIQSSTGRSKAFYTCSSHLAVVSLHYTVIGCQYFTPSATLKFGKLLSLVNTAVVPMLNPIIYCLKNKDVKSALQRQLKNFKTL